MNSMTSARLSSRMRSPVSARSKVCGLKAARAAKKAIIGTTSDPAGTTTLRAILAQTNANMTSAATIKALTRLTIDGVQADRDTDRAVAELTRAALRLARLATGAVDTANVGTPDTEA